MQNFIDGSLFFRVISHQIILAKEYIELFGNKAFGCRTIDIDTVNYEIKIRFVEIDLGIVKLRDAILNRERMKMESFGEDQIFVLRGVIKIPPVDGFGVGLKRAPIDVTMDLQFLRLFLIFDNGDHRVRRVL